MIVSLCGTLVEATPTSVVLDVSGVGYELGVSSYTLSDLPSVGTPAVSLYTRLKVRDDGPYLYGFSTKDERTLFDKLTGISGIGPKAALATLSSFTPSELAQVVADKDLDKMCSIPGVGKKTASRLLLELDSLFKNDASLSVIAGVIEASSTKSARTPAARSVMKETTEALLSLGFSSQETDVALSNFDFDDKSATVEDALQFALSSLGGK